MTPKIRPALSWHALDTADVLGQLASQVAGLSAEEAGRRLQTYGPNRLRPPQRRGPLMRLLRVKDLRINESILTGEAEPAVKATAPVLYPAHYPPADPVDQYDQLRHPGHDPGFRSPGEGHHAPPAAAGGEPLLSRLLVWRIGFVSVLFVTGVFGIFLWAGSQGADVETARTLAVNTLVVLEVFYLFSVRYLDAPSLTFEGVLGTPAVLAAVGAVAVLQLAFTYAPFIQQIFATRALNVAECAAVLTVGVAGFAVVEIEKAIRRRLGLSSSRPPDRAQPA